MTDFGELEEIVRGLKQGQVDLLTDMARAMTGEIPEQLGETSDICDRRFADYFSNRLRLHHATASQADKFTKKPFEFAFVDASRAAGRNGRIIPSSTHPGPDVEVEGELFSLKTEGAANVSPRTILISKFMEAKWIDRCETTEDFAREAPPRLVQHLNRYDRILTLRSTNASNFKVKYELIEIPRDLMLRVDTLRAEDFSETTASNSSGADVLGEDGTKAFRVSLDGSDAKVTIRGLRVDLCRFHGSWMVQAPIQED